MKTPLYGKTLPELSALTGELGLPAYAAKQIAGWLYRRNAASIDGMTDLSAKTRALMNERYEVGLLPPETVQTSTDGTKKYLFPVAGGNHVEAAYIPDRDRATLCLSSQAGCRMGCRFCMTGRMGLKGNLTATGILNQFRSLPEHSTLTNLVFMGMGEPFDNLEEVMKSLEILTADYGYAWAPKRITVSTIGVSAAVRRFMDNCRCHLALSLHHPTHEGRLRLMPVENKYPAAETIELLRGYDLNRQRRISIEYVMLAGVNDSPAEAKELVRLLNGLRCRVNLIPFHADAASVFTPSSPAAIAAFAEALHRKGLTVTVRQSRGMDIAAACGMLARG
jgi:23S rRNA (adenine2503-C2)-methyltransferase